MVTVNTYSELEAAVLRDETVIRLEGGASTGLAQFLAGYCTLEEAVYATNIKGGYLIPAGKEIANPMPLLDSPEFAQLMDHLSQAFDVVLLDAPPIGMVVDGAVVAKNCDGVVLVIEHAKRRKGEVLDAVKQIRQSGCPVVGCIINRVSVRTRSERSYYRNHYYSYSHYSAYGNGYGYGREEEQEDKKGREKHRKPDPGGGSRRRQVLRLSGKEPSRRKPDGFLFALSAESGRKKHAAPGPPET